MAYFSEQEMNRRLGNLNRAMEVNRVDAVVINSVHNTLYYSNFWMIPWGREQGLIIPKGGEPVVIAPRIEYDRPAKMSYFEDVRIYWDDASAVAGMVALVKEALYSRGITTGRIGIEEDNVSITLYRALQAALPDLVLVEMEYAMMA